MYVDKTPHCLEYSRKYNCSLQFSFKVLNILILGIFKVCYRVIDFFIDNVLLKKLLKT